MEKRCPYTGLGQSSIASYRDFKKQNFIKCSKVVGMMARAVGDTQLTTKKGVAWWFQKKNIVF